MHSSAPCPHDDGSLPLAGKTKYISKVSFSIKGEALIVHPQECQYAYYIHMLKHAGSMTRKEEPENH